MAGLRNIVIGLMRYCGETNIAAACPRFAAQPCEAVKMIGIDVQFVSILGYSILASNAYALFVEKIVYCSTQDGQANPDIYMMNPDGSGVVQLTTDSEFDGFPEISPDGSKIMWTSNREGNHDVWVMNIDGTNKTKLTTHSEPEIGPSLNPDGTEIAYARGDVYAGGIWKMNADGTGQTELYKSSKNERYPSWSPDGTKMVFSSGDTGSRHLVTINSSDGSNATTLSTITTPIVQNGIRRIRTRSYIMCI